MHYGVFGSNHPIMSYFESGEIGFPSNIINELPLDGEEDALSTYYHRNRRGQNVVNSKCTFCFQLSLVAVVSPWFIFFRSGLSSTRRSHEKSPCLLVISFYFANSFQYFQLSACLKLYLFKYVISFIYHFPLLTVQIFSRSSLFY